MSENSFFHPEPTGDVELARSLQRLWPHREHESGALRTLLCLIGIHHWLQPDFNAFVPHRSIRFCHWCSTVEIDGVCYR